MASAKLRAAACHVAPVFMSSKATTDKCISLIRQAAIHKANLVVFPESFLPGFPIWSSLRPPSENHELFKTIARESVAIDGEEVTALRSAAKQNNVLVSVGISEKVGFSTATLFNSNILINTDGEILVHHRKLMPTFFEKLTWSPGDGHGLRVAETEFGKIGNLICGENTNPLARYALIAQGEQVHISSWPAIWPTRPPIGEDERPPPQIDQPENSPNAKSVQTGKGYDIVAANRIRAAAHCFEGKCFGIVSAAFYNSDTADVTAQGSSDPDKIKRMLSCAPCAATMYLDPNGALLPGFTISPEGKVVAKDFLQHEEDVLYADLDLAQCIEGKQYHDVAGGYQRFDVFELKVNRKRRGPISFYEESRNPSDRE